MTVCALKTATRYGKLPLGLARVIVTVFASVAFAPPAGRTPFRPELPAATRRATAATTSAGGDGARGRGPRRGRLRPPRREAAVGAGVAGGHEALHRRDGVVGGERRPVM